MNKIFKVNVNNIMTVEESVVDPISSSSYDHVVRTTCLKSYEPIIDLNLSDEINQRRLNQFKKENEGLVGNGYTILGLTNRGELIEMYSGIKVIPVKSKACHNLGAVQYYDAFEVEDYRKLYVPISCIKAVNQEDICNRRCVEKEIVDPLKNRLEFVQKLHSKNKQYTK